MTRVAVVTGGASGIGLATCEHFARRGDRVGVLDLNENAAKEAAESLRSTGARAVGCGVDVADRKAVDGAMATVRNELGPIDILVTSAGMDTYALLPDLEIDMWERILAVNLTGTFHCIQSAVPDMLERSWGRIVTLASSAGLGAPAGLSAYGASKGGVIALSKSLAREFGPHGVTVNTIPPYLIETPMVRAAREAGEIPSADDSLKAIPLGRFGTPDDIAATCAFLCSDEGGYITGQTISPNGGALL